MNKKNQYGLYDEDRLPTAVVAPVLEYAFSQWHVFRLPRMGESLYRTNGHWTACELISAHHGMSASTWMKRLTRILSGEMETCSLNVVDHFLVILGQHHLWYVEPLSDYYFSPQVLEAA